MAYLESKGKALSRTKEKKPVVTLIFRDACGHILICSGWKALAGSTRDDLSPLMDHVNVGKIYDIYFSVETFYNLGVCNDYALTRNLGDISGVVQTLDAIVEVTKALPPAFIEEYGQPPNWFQNRQGLTIDSDSEDENYIAPPPPPAKRRKNKDKKPKALDFGVWPVEDLGTSEVPPGASTANAAEVPPDVTLEPPPIGEQVPSTEGDQSEAPIGASNVAMPETGAGADESPGAVAVKKPKTQTKTKRH
ncbi:hypothetical protein CYMTET_54624 [Cymbomonas tetramitiformis]|uniref:Uncharacterized protein n=1 Tax=Cymbomonas tetramitiformis TaxID=36881 RepID=A0AAE0BFY5_9CHLO|nr:hypothetical protein CYMTET_54624 [Cymbomonas tetramitiformis]